LAITVHINDLHHGAADSHTHRDGNGESEGDIPKGEEETLKARRPLMHKAVGGVPGAIGIEYWHAPKLEIDEPQCDKWYTRSIMERQKKLTLGVKQTVRMPTMQGMKLRTKDKNNKAV
jgi:hypothetical protein